METVGRTQKDGTHTEAARARAMVYYALAEALAGPVPGIDQRLLDAVTGGARFLGSTACRQAALDLLEFPIPDIQALLDTYTNLIAHPGRRPVALYESLHRYGSLTGQVTWDVERHYRSLGLIPVDGELHDHASLELAFLGHLAIAEAEAGAVGDERLAASSRAEQRTFLRSHAGVWLPDVGIALAATGDPFYASVGRLLSGFLGEELVGRKGNGQAGAQLPTLKDPAACTLCGLCARACRFGALRVIESATETALTLNPAHCTGCARCVHICPESLLWLSSASAQGADHRVVLRSPRARCPNCGRPTVSQAELSAVFARLQPDPAMQRRLLACVECKSWSL